MLDPEQCVLCSGGAAGELYTGKLERRLLGCGEQIGSYSPTQELVPTPIPEVTQ